MHQQVQVLEWNGEAYHRLSDLQYELAMDFIAELEFTGDEMVLDAGCGSGRITLEILERLPRGGVLGVDLSHSMLETARRVVVAGAGQSASFVQADLQHYVAPQAVDMVFSSMALHFVHDHATLFHNLARSLRPGGVLAVQFGRTMQLGQMGEQILQLLNAPPFAEHLQGAAFDFRGGEPDSTETYLLAAGFVDVQVEVVPAPMVGEQRDKMVEFFNVTIRRDCLTRLPTDALRVAFSERMDSFLTQAFAAPFEFLRVRARLPR